MNGVGMDSSTWSQSYTDPPANRQPRFANNVLQAGVAAGQANRDFSSQQQHQQSPSQQMPPAQGTYSTNPSSSSYQPYHNQGINTNSASNITSPLTRPDNHDFIDVSMGETDLYNGSKYGQTSRNQPLQQQQQQQQQQNSTASPSSRQPYLQGGEDFGSGQRYSPMNPTNLQGQYGAPPQNVQHTPASSNYTPLSSNFQNRQSPTRPSYQNTQSNQSSYYSQADSPLANGPPSLTPSQHGYQATPHSSRTGSINSGPQLPPISVSTNNIEPSRHFPTSAVLSPYEQRPHSPTRSMQAPPQQPVEPPRLIRINNPSELQPKLNKQPAFRRANPEGGFISPLLALTTFLPSTYRICNPNFKYESSKNPRRVLTKPSKGVKNDGYDNEDSDYILYVNDTLGSEENGHKNRYLILDVLGQGTFGQVVKCQNLKTQEVVAVKVIKNRTAYFNQSMMEVSVLDLLNKKLDKNDEHHILRLQDTFIHRQHLCLVFELLSVNLYELIKQNQFRGLSTTLVRVFAQQLLHALALLNKANLIHCDLKPENILLKNLESPMIKVIDFGSACDERQTVYTYIQSRFYRSPEVLLGLPYSSAIDMWSLGCIVVELFLGLPLFPGSSEYNQVARIHEMLGTPPAWMIEMGKQSGEYFERTEDEYGRKNYRLKSMEKYMKEHGTKEQPSKKYFSATTLPDIIRQYALPRKNMKPIEVEREMNNRVAFIDFVRGLLNINPLERWSPQQAKLHPFITQAKFTGPFTPPTNLKSSSMAKSPAPGTQQQQAAMQKYLEQELRQRQAQAQAQAQQQQAQQAQQQQAQQQAAQQAQQYAMGGYHQGQPAPVYNNMYTPPQAPNSAAASYGATPNASYGGQSHLPTHVNANPQMQQQQQQAQYNQHQQQPSLYQQASTRSAMNRQRASTGVDGVPVQIQRAASLMDPSQPIRLQPSPAYYPPPADGSAARRGKGGQGSKEYQKNKDLIRNLEDRTLEDGNMFSHWGGGGGN